MKKGLFVPFLLLCLFQGTNLFGQGKKLDSLYELLKTQFAALLFVEKCPVFLILSEQQVSR